MIRREETIGSCRLLLGDCLEILPTLGGNHHENSTEGQRFAPRTGEKGLGATAAGDAGALRERSGVTAGDGLAVRCDTGGLPTCAEANGSSIEIKGEVRFGEWEIPGRDAKHRVPEDGGKDRVQPLRYNGAACDPSQGRGAHEQCPEQSRGALLAVSHQPSQTRVVEFPEGWCILTDPPYGIGITKSNRLAVSRGLGGKSWDDKPADLSWLDTDRVPAIVWGGNYFDLPPHRAPLVWDKNNAGRDFADFEMAWTNLDMVARRFVFRPMNMDGGKLHPTQKPIQVMQWCLGFLPDAKTILDPYMGSGTTGVACAKTGRSFIGIEIDETYFDIACERIRKAYSQPDFFVQAKPPEPIQQPLFGEAAA